MQPILGVDGWKLYMLPNKEGWIWRDQFYYTVDGGKNWSKDERLSEAWDVYFKKKVGGGFSPNSLSQRIRFPLPIRWTKASLGILVGS